MKRVSESHAFLVVRFRASTAFELVMSQTEDEFLASNDLRAGYPEFLSLPDLLCNGAREWSGIAFTFQSPNFEKVATFFSGSEDKNVRILYPNSPVNLMRYGSSSAVSHVEIVWTDREDIDYIAAQFTNIVFLYDGSVKDTDQIAQGIVITDYDDVLKCSGATSLAYPDPKRVFVQI